MHDLILEFVDDDYICEVSIQKSHFISRCNNSSYMYFVCMLNHFAESTMDRIRIKVPFASAMVEIIAQIIDGETALIKPINLIKRIYCMNYISMDPTNCLIKLLSMDSLNIDSDTCDLIQQFVKQKEYETSGYISKLFDLMVKSTARDFLIVKNERNVIVYDVKLNRTIRKISFAPDEQYLHSRDIHIRLAINPIFPIITLYTKKRIVLYDIFNGQVIHDSLKKNTDHYIFPVSFSPDGKRMFVSNYSRICVYEIPCMKKIDEHLNNSYISYMECNSNGTLLATAANMTLHHLCISIYDLATNTEPKEIYRGDVDRIHFINTHTLIWREQYMRCIMLYDICTDKLIRIDDLMGSYVKLMIDLRKQIIIAYRASESLFSTVKSICRAAVYRIEGDDDITIKKIGTIKSNVMGICNPSCCISHNGKYIYSRQINRNFGNIIKLDFVTNGVLDGSKVFDYNYRTVHDCDMYNVQYHDSSKLYGIKQLLGDNIPENIMNWSWSKPIFE